MASVIRIKRRINEDPAEALFLSCKRRRETDSLEVKSVLSFAGTISSKDEPVSSHIKKAIQQKKIHKELHPHMTSFRHPSHLPEAAHKLRKETEQQSRTNRYRVTWSRRALDLDLLDKDGEHDETSSCEDSETAQEKATQSPAVCDKHADDGNHASTKTKPCDSENKENNFNSSCTSNYPSQDATASPKDLTSDRAAHENVTLSTENISGCSSSSVSDDSRSLVKEDKMFCILDVENEVEDDPIRVLDTHQSSGITLNDVPLRSKKVTSFTKNESQYVYDLYFTHNNLGDLDKEAVLTVEALCDELVNEQDDDDPEKELVYDDEDDSNDENNWRADYPDEDPRFFENAIEDYDYAEDMLDTNFLRDDDGDELAYWMDRRCKVDVDSDDGEDEYEGESSSSSDDEKEY